MSFKERNVYQGWLIKTCGLTDPDDFARLGQIFADLEIGLGRCPTPWEVVQQVIK